MAGTPVEVLTSAFLAGRVALDDGWIRSTQARAMARPAASALRAENGGILRVADRPVGVVLGDQRCEVAAPDFDQSAVGFKVKLDAVDGAPDPKCLDIGTVAGREMHGAGRQHERVGMPVKNGTSVAERADEGIASFPPRSAAPPASRTRSAGREYSSRHGRGRRAGRRGRCRAPPCRPRRTAGSGSQRGR